MRYDKLTGPNDSARTAALWKLQKAPHGGDNSIVNAHRPAWAFGFNVCEDGVAVGQCVLRPDEPHDRF